jgi:hypothetical protein
MATWKTRGLRGSAFESLINSTNEYYRKAHSNEEPEHLSFGLGDLLVAVGF